MHEIYLKLPWVPSYGSYYRQTRNGKFITASGKTFREAVIAAAHEQNAYKLMANSPLEFSAILYPPDKRVRDFDNHLKALQDSLTNAKVWVDDGVIDQMHVYRGVIVPKGMVLVKISEGAMLLPAFNIAEKVWDYIGD